jgi:hypothetical protein
MSHAMRYLVVLPDPATARGPDPALAFQARGAEAFASELAAALRTPTLFERWRTAQADPDQVDPSLGATDPAARVEGSQHDLRIELVVTTSLPGRLLTQRLHWLAGDGWRLHDVRPA